MEQSQVRVLWARRHPLDEDAKAGFLPGESIQWTNQEIIWPAEAGECRALAYSLLGKFDKLAGVWPAQAVEAISALVDRQSSWTQGGVAFSPVSVPVQEEDGSKTRRFRFVRWAKIA